MTQRRRLGKYELIETIGQGDVLTVYRARDIEHDKSVVLKLVHSHLHDDTDLIIRFRQRAEQLLNLRHPSILPVLDVHLEQDASYLVSEMPDGETLERRQAKQGVLEIDDALSIISEIADALDYAHEQGICHHDLRPINIILQDQTTVLGNFLLMEAIGATPTYMAPEQLEETSAESPDHRSDAYALGVVVYEMLTGRPPFEGETADVAAAHLTQRPLAPRVHNSDLLPAVDAILLKALAKQPKSRYQSAGELATYLHEAVQTAQTRRMADDALFDVKTRATAGPTFEPVSTDNKSGIPAWVWVGSGILMVVVIAIVILLITG